MSRMPMTAAGLVLTMGIAGAAGGESFPKEGSYDIHSCFSGVSNTVESDKSHSATTVDFWGAAFSNPAGGLFDKSSFHCVGMRTTIEGKTTGTNYCEVVFPDGDKVLSRYNSGPDGITTEAVSGTGKFEGVVLKGSYVGMGPSPSVRPGTFQACNHQTGTYKLK